MKICAICSEEFELKPGKPGFANRCPECSVADEAGGPTDAGDNVSSEMNAARRQAIRQLLYSKDS